MSSFYFVGHPVGRVVFDGTLVLWASTEFRQTLRRRTEATSWGHASRFVIVLSAIGAFGLATLARDTVPVAAFPSKPVTVVLGVVLVWVGIGLRWWSFRTLGRYFTVDVMTSTDQPVISTGPYRIVRHPSYAALLLICAGGGISYANWLSLGGVILLPLLGLLNRMRVEEAALSATLGEAYSSYARSHKRIIPFVW
jgi:protein-S-isoprenylcysteine O-methyltransferase Ste14